MAVAGGYATKERKAAADRRWREKNPEKQKRLRLRAYLKHCRKCNIGLGYYADQPGRLRAAAAYLERAR